MASGKTHIITGCGAGLAVSCLDQGKKSELAHNPAIAVPLAGFFGKLPDILEPATNPHHRQFCHSIAVFAGIGYGLKKAYDWKPENNKEAFYRGLALVAGAGYLSHLLFDATTPMSLPVIGKF